MANDPNKIPLGFMQDVIHGFKTVYPVPIALGCSFDPELVEKCCAMAAKEASLGGVQVTFAPMADLARDARWGRVVETTGEDPYMNGLYAAAAVKGFQGDDLSDKNHVAACLKHFAAYGAAEAGRDYNTVDMSERTLREFYLSGYKAAAEAGVAMAMTSFNVYDGIPLTANKALTEGILRNEWGWDGVIISDYNAF
jgi:beta-glucosidase